MNNEKQQIRTCPHCHQTFQNISGRTFSNHVRWCKENPDKDRLSGKKICEKQKESRLRYLDRHDGKLRSFTVICDSCGKQFEVMERERKFPSRNKYFCSRSCSNKRKYSIEQIQSRSETRKKRMKKFGINGKPLYKTIEKECKQCHKIFHVKENSKQCFCGVSCAAQYRTQIRYQEKINRCQTDIERTKIELQKYRVQCQFKFAVKDFPEEFDFSLIKKYGWYKAKNRGNNPNGISRDHMYSVMDGFINHIDPKIISHPANCQLLPQKENASKSSTSSITLDDLLKRIEKWNNKYQKQV